MAETQALLPTTLSKKFHGLWIRRLMSDGDHHVADRDSIADETVGGGEEVNDSETEENRPALDTFEALLDWTRTTVFHFIAKCVLELHCRQPEAMRYPITITFIATDHSVLRFPSWPSIRDIIKKSLSPDDPYDEIVKAFEKQVGQTDSKDKLLVSLRKSLETQCDDEFPGTLHCEAVLAAMALYPEPATQDDTDQLLTNIAKALRIGGIRVSKLCCPACSRLFHCLLQIYEEQHENDEHRPKILTQALASHTVPYPIQLPQWLPGDVVEHMVTFFRPLLAEALQSLVSPPGDAPVISPGKVHRSQQSLSNLSVGSSNAEVTSTSEIPDRFTLAE